LPAGDSEPAPGEDGPVVAGGRRDLRLNSDTAAVVLGGPGYPLTHPDLPVAEVVLELLAGSNASVLNEEIRSARGLSYDVWGMATGYRDTGAWRAGFSTAPDLFAEVAELAADLVTGAVARGWTEDEVAVARRRVAGLLLLDSETTLDDVLLL